MNANLKGVLHAIVNIGGNILLMDVIPAEYKGWALLVFNLLQVVYAYIDETYVIQKYGLARR